MMNLEAIEAIRASIRKERAEQGLDEVTEPTELAPIGRTLNEAA